jgi:protein TonB
VFEPATPVVPAPVEPRPAEPPKAVTPGPAKTLPAPQPRPAAPAPTVVARPPVVRERATPTYPPKAQKLGGQVVLRVLVSEDGRVLRVVVDENTADSRAEAPTIDAVLRSKYEPALEDGKPVKAWITETFRVE